MDSITKQLGEYVSPEALVIVIQPTNIFMQSPGGGGTENPGGGQGF